MAQHRLHIYYYIANVSDTNPLIMARILNNSEGTYNFGLAAKKETYSLK